MKTTVTTIALLLLLAVTACGQSSGTVETVDKQQSSQEDPRSPSVEEIATEPRGATTTTDLVAQQPAERSVEEEIDVSPATTTFTLLVQEQPIEESVREEGKLLYLEEDIPPCVPPEASERDPCALGAVPFVETADITTYDFGGEIPAYWELYYDEHQARFPLLLPHLIVRATFLSNTTRCSMYDRQPPNFAGHLQVAVRYFFCFTDAGINDYLIGTGPPTLTVVAANYPFPLGNPDDIVGEGYDVWTENRRLEVANAYEGIESILFLSPSPTTNVESWNVTELWDVQQINGTTKVISPYLQYFEHTPETLARLVVSLSDFETTMAEAATTRAARHEGRTGANPGLPMLITDANLLRPYYEQVGVAYETDAPASPPPIPGEEDSSQPPANTGGQDTTTTNTIPIPGGEDTPGTPGNSGGNNPPPTPGQ